MATTNSGVFSDFCQAWMARFPGSELPTAWEEDVRANLVIISKKSFLFHFSFVLFFSVG
jgi:hypothetical protein